MLRSFARAMDEIHKPPRMASVLMLQGTYISREKWWCMSKLKTYPPLKRPHSPCADLSGSSGQQSWRSSLKRKKKYVHPMENYHGFSQGILGSPRSTKNGRFVTQPDTSLHTLYGSTDPHLPVVFRCNPPPLYKTKRPIPLFRPKDVGLLLLLHCSF